MKKEKSNPAKKLVIDAHCDAILKEYYKKTHWRDPGELQVTKEKLKKGGVHLQVFAVFVPPPMERFALDPAVDMIALLYEMIENDRDYLLVTEKAQMESLRSSEKIGIVLGLEGAEPLGNNLQRLDVFHRLGVRLITLTWSRRNYFADGSTWDPAHDTLHGLTYLGKELIRKMNERKMIIDLSHLNDTAFYQVLDLSSLPVIASHSCARKLKNSPRNLTDDQIQKLAEHKGVVGINFYSAFLSDGPKVTIDDVVQHIDYICNLTGKSDFVGLGSDFDGIDSWPEGLEDASKIQDIRPLLKKKGYRPKDIEKIMGENFARVFAENWK